MIKVLIWAVAIYVMYTLQQRDSLNIFTIFLIIFTASIFSNIFSKKDSAEEDDDDSHERLRQANENLKKQTESLRKQTEEIKKQRQQWSPPPPPRPIVPTNVVRLEVKSIKTLRNLLMKHHEMKGADKSYQESDMCKNTNHIVQQLNDIIASHK